MSLELEPGNALGCTVNSHRQGWDGTICTNASAWSCGAKQDFRDDYCAQGDSRCFHIHLFHEKDPYLLIPDDGVGWLLDDDTHALDDQIFLLWGRQFGEPRGIAEGRAVQKLVFGAYRIQGVQRLQHGYRTDWRLVPYADGWTRMAALRVELPRIQHLEGPYIKQLERASVERMFKQALDIANEGGVRWHVPEDEQRFLSFARNVETWFDSASRKVRRPTARAPERTTISGRLSMTNFALREGLRGVSEQIKAPTERIKVPESSPSIVKEPAPAAAAPAALVHDSVFAAGAYLPLVEGRKRDWIAARHGAAALTRILVGSMTKPLLILRGNPGVGKSTLALNLIDDAERSRTLVVPVSSTWRGREDLLGYINPIHNNFEPTRFTNFLHQAGKAWDGGDRRAWIVVFEEFNLSQPEYWLSDVMVRSQFPADARRDRTLELGGHSVRGWGAAEMPELFLSPAVRFVATINNDHTTRPLSPRILDRAAVVEVAIDPRDAVRLAGLTLDDEQGEAIADLDYITCVKGATFSLRSALSLRACAGELGALGIDLWAAIDLVLVQEVLSKVRLLVGDPADLHLVEKLKEWSARRGKSLPECARAIASWDEMLQEGLDVSQA